MIATQNQALGVEADLQRDLLDKLPEACGSHSCITTFLVYLIAGLLDQYVCVMIKSVTKLRLDNDRMSCANGEKTQASTVIGLSRQGLHQSTFHVLHPHCRIDASTRFQIKQVNVGG